MFLKELFEATASAVKKAYLGYDEYNIRYSKDHLDMMFPKILEITIHEQAEYADYITVSNVNKDWYIQSLIETELSEYDLQIANTTGIGNLAYISLNCKNEEARRKALLDLAKIKEHFKKI